MSTKAPEPSKRYRYNEMWKWEGRWELIDGVPYNMTLAPTSTHQRIVGEMYFRLRMYLQGKKCELFIAPFDVRLSETEDYDNPDTVCQPDLSIVCNPRQIDERGCKGAPTLIVEVLSPNTAFRDRNQKFKLYERFGVAEYWIVDPAHRTIEVYGAEEGSYRKREVFGEEGTLVSFIFADLALDLNAVFNQEQSNE